MNEANIQNGRVTAYNENCDIYFSILYPHSFFSYILFSAILFLLCCWISFFPLSLFPKKIFPFFQFLNRKGWNYTHNTRKTLFNFSDFSQKKWHLWPKYHGYMPHLDLSTALSLATPWIYPKIKDNITEVRSNFGRLLTSPFTKIHIIPPIFTICKNISLMPLRTTSGLVWNGSRSKVLLFGVADYPMELREQFHFWSLNAFLIL